MRLQVPAESTSKHQITWSWSTGSFEPPEMGPGNQTESSGEQQVLLAAPEPAFWVLLLAFETGLQYVTLTDLKVIYLPLLRLKAYATMPSSLELILTLNMNFSGQ